MTAVKSIFLSAFWRRPYSTNSKFAVLKVLLAADLGAGHAGEIWGVQIGGCGEGGG